MIDKQLLADSQALADFANLVDTEAQGFGLKHPGFVPGWWWTVRLSMAEDDRVWVQWEKTQHTLRGAWGKKFPLDDCVELIAAGAVHPMNMLSSLLSDLGYDPKTVWPYQRAVMFLALNPWRMRFCMGCGKRFVADVPKRKFCSTNSECFANHRRQVKRAWFQEHGKEWRAKRKKKKQASTNPKRSGKRGS